MERAFLAETAETVPVPVAVLTEILPLVTDIAEAQVLLAVIRLATAAGAIDAPISHDALFGDRPLRRALKSGGSPREPDHRITLGMDLAIGRGTLLSFATEQGSRRRSWIVLATPASQAQVAAMTRGAVPPPTTLWDGDEAPSVVAERPNAFRLYEQNIGMLTPLVADKVMDALERYPSDWIEDAIAEAVAYNKRSWRYIQGILENWAVQGRGDQRDRR